MVYGNTNTDGLSRTSGDRSVVFAASGARPISETLGRMAGPKYGVNSLGNANDMTD
jgi:hypothetical protein